MAAGAFLSDVRTLRERARRHIEQGAVTPSYKADVQTVVKLLNQALATEIVCVLRYKRHYYMATGINAPQAQQEFLQHANDEQMHADQIAARIVQLGGGRAEFLPRRPSISQPRRICRGRKPGGNDQRRPRGRTSRYRLIWRDDPLPGRQRPDNPAHA